MFRKMLKYKYSHTALLSIFKKLVGAKCLDLRSYQMSSSKKRSLKNEEREAEQLVDST